MNLRDFCELILLEISGHKFSSDCCFEIIYGGAVQDGTRQHLLIINATFIRQHIG